MKDKLGAVLGAGLAASLVAVVVLAVLSTRQRSRVVRLERQVVEIEARACEETAQDVVECTCESQERLLAACSTSLKRARALVKVGSGPTAGGEPESGAGYPDGGQQQFPNAPPGYAAAAAAAQENAERRVQDLFGAKLGLAGEEMGSLGELVCATMALREALLADYGAGRSDADKTWQELAVLRKDLTAEMEEILGPERYAEFRAAGGIGALASVTECGGPP